MYMWLTRENEGYCKNDKEATEETDTESCPGQSRLSQVKRKTEFNKYTDTGWHKEPNHFSASDRNSEINSHTALF